MAGLVVPHFRRPLTETTPAIHPHTARAAAPAARSQHRSERNPTVPAPNFEPARRSVAVPPIPNQIYDTPRPNRNLRLPCPALPRRKETHAPAAKETVARARETEEERRGEAAEARRRRVPAMERYHPSEVYELFVRHMNTPRVVVDNGDCPTATLVQVHSAWKHGVLLEAVAALSDHGVCVRKGYISSDDGRWFMDVFHVTDAAGRKVADADALLARLESSLSADALPPRTPPAAAASAAAGAHTLLELVGADRPGLLSEVFAVLHDLRCGIVDARAWTHGGRVAALVFVRDEETGAPIDDLARVRRVESRLRHVLRGGARGARTVVLADAAAVNMDRRLHQLLDEDGKAEAASTSAVAVQDWGERGYSVVTVSCRDRPKLLFDVVCTLTDLDYVVYHGTFDTDGDHAQQEFYIRRLDGRPISSAAERRRVIQCLQAAIDRRASEGVRLELRITDRRGLLAYVTRVFRENSLSVTHAEINTRGDMAMNVFHVTDAAGRPADPKTIDDVIQKIGTESLRVDEERWPRLCSTEGDASRGGAGIFSLGSLVKKNLVSLGLIRSCS